MHIAAYGVRAHGTDSIVFSRAAGDVDTRAGFEGGDDFRIRSRRGSNEG